MAQVVRISDRCHERLKKIQVQKAVNGEGVVSYGRIVEQGLVLLDEEKDGEGWKGRVRPRS